MYLSSYKAKPRNLARFLDKCTFDSMAFIEYGDTKPMYQTQGKRDGDRCNEVGGRGRRRGDDRCRGGGG